MSVTDSENWDVVKTKSPAAIFRALPSIGRGRGRKATKDLPTMWEFAVRKGRSEMERKMGNL